MLNKSFENTVAKGEIARNEQFLLFQQCFLPFEKIVGKGVDVGVFPKQQILESSKLKESADENFEFDENGRNFSSRVENTMGKGEIAKRINFSFSDSVFIKIRENKG